MGFIVQSFSLLGLGLFVLLMLVPCALVFILQLWLCFKLAKFALKLLPLVLGLILVLIAVALGGAGIFGVLLGGLFGIVVLGLAFALVVASIFGWAVYAIVKLLF